jgi:limonene-1,2-epoxide hydrolase
MTATEAGDIVNRFVAAWERADVDELLDFFTDDAVWHPMPLEPTVGKPALRDAFTQWMTSTEQLGVEIHRQVSDGTIVMHERTDRLMLGTEEMATAVAAVFEIDNGRISAWREYFDMSPYVAPS